MKVKELISILQTLDPELEMCQYPVSDDYPKNFRPCPTCGQIRPFPTEPGKWEFHESITLEESCDMPWTPCEVKLPQKGERYFEDGGLRLWVEEHDEPVWWPQRGAAWRKVE